MTRAYNERRNRKVIMLVERRKIPQKEVARILEISYGNVRWIMHCRNRELRKNLVGNSTVNQNQI